MLGVLLTVGAYQLWIKAHQSFVIKPVWASSQENTPISILLVSDNAITKSFGEYKDTEEDENTLYTFSAVCGCRASVL